jgi:hypothetical protein
MAREAKKLLRKILSMENTTKVKLKKAMASKF